MKKQQQQREFDLIWFDLISFFGLIRIIDYDDDDDGGGGGEEL
jgi:molybdopterin/thiamine biosynthesis adenylyltransferase